MEQRVLKLCSAIIFLGLGFIFSPKAFAQDSYFTGEVLSVTTEEYLVGVTGPSRVGEQVAVPFGAVKVANQPDYKEGDSVILQESLPEGQQEASYFILSYNRTRPLKLIFGAFFVLAVLVAGRRGFLALVGMGLSFLVIFKFLLPKILAGASPILIALVTSILLVPLTFYLSHGVSKKTTTAVISTIVSLALVVGFSFLAINWLKLSGLSSDEAVFVHLMGENINLKGLLLAGIMVGSLGILDDITVAQAAVVEKIAGAFKRRPGREIFLDALSVGKDHIASMVNTLILVYAGASLPLLLLFVTGDRPAFVLLSSEMISEEIVRSLVGSLGLILAVPITTALAVSNHLGRSEVGVDGK